MAGIFLVLAAQVLAGNDRAAGGQGRQNLNNQNIQAVHQRNAGNSGFAHAGDHQCIGHAHGHAEGLLQQQGPDQGKKRPFSEERRLRLCSGYHEITPFFLGFYRYYTAKFIRNQRFDTCTKYNVKPCNGSVCSQNGEKSNRTDIAHFTKKQGPGRRGTRPGQGNTAAWRLLRAC